MDEKKITKDEIRRAIIYKYGSIENYAEVIGTKRQNIYDKISNRSAKFLKELKDNGVVLNNGIQIGKAGMNNNKGSINFGADNSEVESLKNEIVMLKELLKAKDKVIELLENKTH